MFRAALSKAHYRAPASLPTTPGSLAKRTVPAAYARRFYSDKSEEPAPKKDEASNGAAQEKNSDATASSPAPTTEAGELEKLKKNLAEKDAKIKELKDAYLRSLAEAENIRSRSKVEIENTKSFAIQKFAKDLLDTVDILELALKHVPKDHLADKVVNKSLVDLFEGVDLTKSNLLRTLERHGVESFDPLDKPYDPNTAQALYQAPMPGKTPGSVFAVEKRGYILKGRVLRPAQVGVVLDPSGN
ncbi:GrpE, mitochondrial [Coemansia spiralis]|uniref:GrpE protein homolog n=2 Tax=Coemansia TaxID=4863 RepID=A0A9W8G8Q0_9FUNG|nr:GrpE-domain-containing protein [Coemansia spiralis]KAJ1990911.1 GrpE, mitochondrial [Coemansia umbellata]KAJ2621690.1 GrpE, mitochondrial [Coemansia sp. RSA 1358]KAJ2676837.1 GrpE, mitochondrial [Coemansia spiralis]